MIKEIRVADLRIALGELLIDVEREKKIYILTKTKKKRRVAVLIPVEYLNLLQQYKELDLAINAINGSPDIPFKDAYNYYKDLIWKKWHKE